MRDVLSRLEDHRVSAHERRKHLPGRDRHRKVERADETRHADRTAVAHRPLVPQLARDGLSKQPPALARRVEYAVSIPSCPSPEFQSVLPHLARHRVGDFFLPLRHDVADESKDIPPRGSRSAPPDGEAALGALDGAIHVAPVGEWEPPDHIIAIGWIVVLEVLARIRARPISRRCSC